MRLLKLYTKSNLLDDIMSLSNPFNELKSVDHSRSLHNLSQWLDHKSKTPRKMRPLYKVAASILITGLVLVACSIPVEQEQEIGYMIKGVTTEFSPKMKQGLEAAEMDMNSEVHLNVTVTEDTEGNTVRNAEVVMLLPEADRAAAEAKMASLQKHLTFQKLELLPIEEEIEQPLYEAALSKFNLHWGNKVSDEVMVAKINEMLQKNSNITGKAEIIHTEDGKKLVEIRVEDFSGDKSTLDFIDVESIQEIRVHKSKNKNTVDIQLKEESEIELEDENGTAHIKIRKIKKDQ